MADGPVANLPKGMDAYAGYVNESGIGITFPAVVVFANTQHARAFSITTNGSIAQCADVESGAMSSWQGYDYGYCSVSRVNYLIAQFGRPKKLWTSHYTGQPHLCSPQCWPGLVTTADGTQYIDHGPYDESTLADDFFSLLPPPTPPTKQENDTVTSIVIGGQLHVFGIIGTTSYHWWQEIGPPASAWHNEELPV